MKEMTIGTEEQLASHRDVLVRRTLATDPEGIVGTIEIQTISRTPTLVHVCDEFPTGLPVDTVEFLPGATPDAGEITPHRAVIRQPVGDDPVEIKYGVELSEPVEEVEFTNPTIRNVEPVENPDATVAHTDGGDNRTPPDDAESDSPPTSVSTISPSATATPAADDGGQQAADNSDGAAEAVTGVPIVGRETERSADVTPAVERVPADSGTESGDDAFSDVPELTGAETAAAAGDGPGSDAMADGDTDGTGPGLDRPEDVGRDAGSGASGSRAIDVRLDHLSARVEEFAAYASALEEFLDEQGTAPEFVTRIEGEVADLEARLDAIRDELETLETSHDDAIDDLHDRTEAVEQRLESTRDTAEERFGDLRDHVEDEVGRLDTAMDDQQSDVADLRERVSDVEREVEGFRDTVDAVQSELSTLSEGMEEMREEIETLRTEVADLADLRERLADVFGAPVETQGTADE